MSFFYDGKGNSFGWSYHPLFGRVLKPRTEATIKFHTHPRMATIQHSMFDLLIIKYVSWIDCVKLIDRIPSSTSTLSIINYLLSIMHFTHSTLQHGNRVYTCMSTDVQYVYIALKTHTENKQKRTSVPTVYFWAAASIALSSTYSRYI